MQRIESESDMDLSFLRVASGCVAKARDILEAEDRPIPHPNVHFRRIYDIAHDELLLALTTVFLCEDFGVDQELIRPIRDEILTLLETYNNKSK